ncbi:MAG: hypothetical protein H0W69_00070 [Gemmatimonadaceae bacterium]|nr:hypothetical protein [Gemmatimonadaceae bacterium]
MPERPQQPSDLYSPLTWERLITLRKIFWDTRAYAAQSAEIDIGDDRTIIGYRAWAHARFAINKAAAKQLSGWLSVKHSGPNFTFKIAMVPIRFCRGDSEEAIPPKYRYPQEGEESDIQQAAKESGNKIDGLLRVINEADHNGAPVRVFLVYVDKFGNNIMQWEIPEQMEAGGVEPIVTPTTPITLGPLDSRVKTKREIAEEEAAKAKAEEAEKNKRKDKGA